MMQSWMGHSGHSGMLPHDPGAHHPDHDRGLVQLQSAGQVPEGTTILSHQAVVVPQGVYHPCHVWEPLLDPSPYY